MEYLVKLSNLDISAAQRTTIDGLFSTVNDIERVADHADNIAELAMERVSNNYALVKRPLVNLIP